MRCWTAELSVRRNNSVSEFCRTALEPAASPVLNVGASQSRKDVMYVAITNLLHKNRGLPSSGLEVYNSGNV